MAFLYIWYLATGWHNLKLGSLLKDDITDHFVHRGIAYRLVPCGDFGHSAPLQLHTGQPAPHILLTYSSQPAPQSSHTPLGPIHQPACGAKYSLG